MYDTDFPGETFHILKKKEERKFGEYRSSREVLEAWDTMEIIMKVWRILLPVLPSRNLRENGNGVVLLYDSYGFI